MEPILITELETPDGAFVGAIVFQCRRLMNVFVVKNWRPLINFDKSGVECITDHAKFRIVCLDTDVLNTALVAINNARSNPLTEPIGNRLVVFKI